MKHLKMLVLAAAAASLTVLLGASPASATELCSTNTSPCSGTMYGAGTEGKANLRTGTEAVLKAGFATVKCKISSFRGTSANTGSSTETIINSIENLAYEECNCTVTVLENGELETHTDGAGATGNGIPTGKGTKVTINCSGVTCIFGTSASGTTLGTVSGGNPAIASISAKLPWIAGDGSNSVCTLGTGTATMTAEYEITAPQPVFVE